MNEPFQAVEAFVKAKSGSGVKSYRIYSGHTVEGKVTVKVNVQRNGHNTQ